MDCEIAISHHDIFICALMSIWSSGICLPNSNILMVLLQCFRKTLLFDHTQQHTKAPWGNWFSSKKTCWGNIWAEWKRIGNESGAREQKNLCCRCLRWKSYRWKSKLQSIAPMHIWASSRILWRWCQKRASQSMLCELCSGVAKAFISVVAHALTNFVMVSRKKQMAGNVKI